MKSDSQLKANVEEELDWDPAVRLTSIGVEVKDGIVTLAGHLDSYAEKIAAERAAQRVSGVKGVAVELDIRLLGSASRTDGDIAATAAEALRWNASIPHDSIHVMVEDGWITLSGDVDWNFERANAEATVHALIGVKGVNNVIKLKHRVSPIDVKSKIEAALYRSAHLNGRNIKVSVDGDTVTLTGKIRSLADRRMMKNAAWAAPGVFKVVDDLKIEPYL